MEISPEALSSMGEGMLPQEHRDTTFKATKIAIVTKTLSFQTSLLMLQIFTITSLRVALEYERGEVNHAYELYAAYAMTINERKSVKYLTSAVGKVAGPACTYAGALCGFDTDPAPPPEGNCTTIAEWADYMADAPPWTVATFCQDALSSEAEKQMPWWMVPVQQGVIAVVMYWLIGFDLPFIHKEHHTWCDFVTTFATKFAFIVLAILGWVHDVKALASVDGDSKLQYAIFFLYTLFCSSNLFTAMSVWGAFRIQSPVAATDAKPQYTVMPGFASVGFPLSPCGAAWLHPAKWLLGVVLLPYLIVPVLLQAVPKMLGLAFTCGFGGKKCLECLCWTTRCGPCMALGHWVISIIHCGPCAWCWACCCKPAIFCCFYGVVASATIFTWAWADEHFYYWFWVLFKLEIFLPVFENLFLQLWAAAMPYIFTSIYGFLIGASRDDFKQASLEMLEKEKQSWGDWFIFSLLPAPLALDADTSKQLLLNDPDSAEQDFGLAVPAE